MTRTSGQEPEPDSPFAIADRLHSAAIHLLRRLRLEDSASGLSAPRLSALSVVVFAGPISISDLASAEQVSVPTISRLVKHLEAEGLLTSSPDPRDRRRRQVFCTTRGGRLLHQGRRRRVARLAEEIARLADSERLLLGRAAELLVRMLEPPGRSAGSSSRR